MNAFTCCTNEVMSIEKCSLLPWPKCHLVTIVTYRQVVDWEKGGAATMAVSFDHHDRTRLVSTISARYYIINCLQVILLCEQLFSVFRNCRILSFWPPGSGSFHQKANKLKKKTLISTVLWLVYNFLSKIDVNVPSKRIKYKNIEKNKLFFVGRLKCNPVPFHKQRLLSTW